MYFTNCLFLHQYNNIIELVFLIIISESKKQVLQLINGLFLKCVIIIWNLTIKQMAQINGDKIVCFNPQCLNVTKRVFHKDEHQMHKNCRQWLFQPSKAQKQTVVMEQINQQIVIDFKKNGLRSIEQIISLQNWPKQINQIFENIKYTIGIQIEMIKKQKMNQFAQVQVYARQIYCQITRKYNTYQEEQLSATIQKINNLASFGYLSLNKLKIAQNYFKNEVEINLRKLGDMIQSCTLNPAQLLKINKRQAYEKTCQYLFQNNSIMINEKIQKLTTLSKVQMVKISFDNQTSQYRTTCWICKKACGSQKNDNSKNGCLQQLLNHLLTDHAKQIYYTYMARLLRYQVKQIQFQSYIEMIKCQQIKQVYVIDRENSGLIEKPFQLENGTQWVEVVNRENKNLAKGVYITADSKRKDAADMLISILVYELLRNNLNKIFLVTKDHFGETLVDIMQKMFPNKLQCILPKDICTRFENSTTNMVD